MPTLAYYISDNGYGHATRSIAIIRYLMQRTTDIQLVVCCGRALPFVRQSLSGIGSIRFRAITPDLGYVLRDNSLEADLERFGTAYRQYVDLLPAEVERERRFLADNRISLVLTDISPVAAMAADACSIASIGISNFTWYTAYRSFLPGERLSVLYDAYARMDYFIGLPGAEEPEWGRLGRMKAGFFCRMPDSEAVKKLRRLNDPKSSKTIVMFSPGMGLAIDHFADAQLWKDDNCLFFVPSHLKIRRDNVVSIPASETESQNYVAASDIVITKPGWGTVGEAVVFGKQLCLIKRSLFKEDQHLITAIDSAYPYRMVGWEQLKMADCCGLISALSRQFKPDSEPVDVHQTLRDISNFINQRIEQER